METKKNIIKDPLLHFLEHYKPVISEIKEIVRGKKYVAVHLQNGYIGICSTLGNEVSVETNALAAPEINNIQHRIVLNAYFNALLNYSNTYDNTSDIFDYMDFSKYRNIAMVGYFESLIQKFKSRNIALKIFDQVVTNEQLLPMDKQMSHIRNADAIILTGTTIFNQTFLNITANSNNNCDIFLLGPSTILSKKMFCYKNIKLIFGAVFDKNDQALLNKIRNGSGTKGFLPLMKKVYLVNQQRNEI